ncbi:MAG: UDP-N-acetylmuramoyl-tripeptide--D-alanyl-D-alanine ligase, partial [Oscillospiraceae bacterium]|nr:UDP-N-acetylmuramoyl-tripeptide--D-alanyl-D-alanine ligase [Oscillospiraceae bacterium]
MEAVKLGELLKGVGVTRFPDLEISEVVTDSRLAKKGSLFVAIVGDRLDGNDYAKSALERGAAAVVVSRRMPLEGEQILVKDTKDALIEMAGNYRERFEPKVVAVTGSVGKTTTKEMTAAILSRFGKTLKNEGNKNNEIGMPETLFRLDSSIELAVLEMGMNGLGDISKLTRAARPRAAAITCIGVSHIELLGSKENILKAKLEICEGFPDEHGILVVNGDDELLMSAVEELNYEKVSFAVSNTEADVVAKDIMMRSQSSEFTIDDRYNGEIKAMIPCAGRHNIMNALAAYTLAT